MNELSSFQAVYQDPTFSEFGKPCDVTLKTDDGTEFKAYSKLLSLHSEFFKVLFSMDEENGQITVIHGIEPDVFKTVLIYLYTSHTNITPDNVVQLLVASDFLMIESLRSECVIFLLRNKTIENCFIVFLTAHRIKEFRLEYQYRRFLLLCFEKAIDSSLIEVSSLPFNVLKYFLGHSSINVSGEHVIWSLIETWVRSEPFCRMPKVPELLRFLSINEIGDELAVDIISSPIIRNNELYEGLEDPQETLPYLEDQHKAQMIIIYRNDVPFFTGARLPSSIYFVTRMSLQPDSAEMFLSYDDNLDTWRKLGDISTSRLKLFRINHRIYVFYLHRSFDNTESKGFSYDLLRNEIKPIPAFPSSYSGYTRVVEAAGKIYVFCGTQGVFKYEDETDRWIDLSSDQNMRDLGAVSLFGVVYTIGYGTEGVMIMQAYDPSLDTHRAMSPPAMARYLFASVVYQEKIFLIGGVYHFLMTPSRDVEVYDPLQDDWVLYPELPFEYIVPRTVLWKGRLFLRDCLRPVTPVIFWDGSGEWKVVEDRSPLLQLWDHSFCTIEGEDLVREIMKRNKEVDVSHWKESGLEKELF